MSRSNVICFTWLPLFGEHQVGRCNILYREKVSAGLEIADRELRGGFTSFDQGNLAGEFRDDKCRGLSWPEVIKGACTYDVHTIANKVLVAVEVLGGF